MMRFVFFFSSRRRHTRSLCDWSSDVCSSDLRPFSAEGADEFVEDAGELHWLVALDAVSGALDRHHLSVGATATQLGDVLVVNDWGEPTAQDKHGDLRGGDVLPKRGGIERLQHHVVGVV